MFPPADSRPRLMVPVLSAAIVMFPVAILAQAPSNSELLVPLHPAFHGNIAGLAWTILLVGFVTASFVEWAKDLLGLRSYFHRSVVSNWLRRRADSPSVREAVAQISGFPSPAEGNVSKRAQEQLENLLSPSGDKEEDVHRALPVYSLPAE